MERWLYRVRLQLRSLFRTDAVDRELDDELQDHVDRLTEAHVARGMPRTEARRQALLALGGLEQRKEECRDTRRVRFIQDAAQDIRYAARTLRRMPGFAAAAIGTLTLGLGATIAIFTVVNGVLLRPLPFPQPDRLHYVTLAMPTPFMPQPAMADAHYLELRAADRSFEHLSLYSSRKFNLTNAGEPAVISAGVATAEFFDVLRVPPALGRTFLPDDGQKGREPVIVLGDRLWRNRFNSDPAIVGRNATLDSMSYQIVGVMPPGFEFPTGVDAWVPQVVQLTPGNSLMWPVIGRLKSDVTLAQARAEFDALASWLQPERSGWLVGIYPLKDLLVAGIRRPLQIFVVAVMFVLLIACANVANLLLARASGRHREIAMRAALGASRMRLVRQLLTESTVVSLIGAALGLLLARWLVPALLMLAPKGRIPRPEMIYFDGVVVAFAVSAAGITALVFGLPPALRATRLRGSPSLMSDVRAMPSGSERLRGALVVCEIALALVLLTGAGLMLKSVLRLSAVESGYDADRVVTLNLDLPGSIYSSVERAQAFHTEMLARLATLPEVDAVGAINWRPLGDMIISGDFSADGIVPTRSINVDKPAVSPGYFRAMGIRVRRGREFEPSDMTVNAPVAVVSRSVAQLLDPAEDVLGKRVRVWGPKDWLSIVGVVDDVKQFGPTQPAHPAIYTTYLQPRHAFFLTHMTFVVRAKSDPLALVPAIRTVLRTVDQNQPAASIALMSDVMSATTAGPTFQSGLLGVFALLAVFLALIGTYGVLTYSVSQRTHEIGLRIALGADRRGVLWMVIRRTMLLGIAGVLIGIGGAWLTTRLLATLLFETTPTDPAIFTVVAVLLFTAAVVAGVVPARRATRVDPLVALRHE